MDDAKFDYSLFHPLDHFPGTKRCRSFYGGIRNHLSLTWEYRRKDQVLAPLYWVLCRRGRHDFHLWYDSNFDLAGAYCSHCGRKRDITDEERATHPRLFE